MAAFSTRPYFLNLFRILFRQVAQQRSVHDYPLRCVFSTRNYSTSFPSSNSASLFNIERNFSSQIEKSIKDEAEPETTKVSTSEDIRKNFKGKRYKPTNFAKSMQYLESDVYKETYRDKPVWFYYRRNFKGHYPPPLTRSNCVYNGRLISSNPCPICRDEYLVLDFRNVKLLEQFINPVSSKVLETKITGLCQRQHKRLLFEVEKARDLGTIQCFIPFQLFDYSVYFSHLPPEQLSELLYASGHTADLHSRVSSEEFGRLPVNLQDILLSLQTIPHAEDYLVPEEETVIEKPHVPNRYKMEEDYKQLVAKRRKSPNIIFE